MSKETSNLKLGALLRYAELIEEKQIKRGLTLSRYTGLPLGRCLVLLGVVTSELVRSAIQVQSLLREGLLEARDGKQALSLVQRQGWTLAEAFSSLGIDQVMVNRNRLGDLLIAADWIDDEELELALYINEQSSLPLGYVLALLGTESPAKLKTVLSLQREIRAGRMEQSDAVERLKVVKGNLVEDSSDRNCLFTGLGELLVDAGVITELQLGQIVETSARVNRMSALILIELGLVTRDVLVAAIRLQELIATGAMPAKPACEILSRVARRALSLRPKEEDEGDSFILCFEEFLESTGYLDTHRINCIVDEIVNDPDLSARVLQHILANSPESFDDSKEAIANSLKDSKLLSELLSQCSSVDRKVVDTAIVLYELYKDGLMQIDQAAISFSLQTELTSNEME